MFSRSVIPGNPALGLLSVWSEHTAWWDVTCGQDPKLTQIRRRVSRVFHFIFPFTMASF